MQRSFGEIFKRSCAIEWQQGDPQTGNLKIQRNFIARWIEERNFCFLCDWSGVKGWEELKKVDLALKLCKDFDTRSGHLWIFFKKNFYSFLISQQINEKVIKVMAKDFSKNLWQRPTKTLLIVQFSSYTKGRINPGTKYQNDEGAWERKKTEIYFHIHFHPCLDWQLFALV